MHVPQQRLAVAAVAPVGQRIVVDRTVEISRKFGKHRKGPIRLPHPEQQLLNEILGERGIARERRRIGTERLVVTGVELLPGNGLLPVDPAHELFRFRWSYLHDNLFRLVQNVWRALQKPSKKSVATRGLLANISILNHIYMRFGHFSVRTGQSPALHFSTKKTNRNDIYSEFRPPI